MTAHIRAHVVVTITLLLAAAAIAPQPVRAQDAAGTPQAAPLTIGETFTMHSAVLGEDRVINVYAPPAYSASAGTRLPVLYMPDGGIGEDFLHVAGLVQVSVGNGTMRPFILVGIESTQRRRDLTGPTAVAEDSTIAPQVGGSADFRRFIRTELIPFIDARYRTTDERAIVGESLAGLFIVETFFMEPDLFDTYIAFDPSLWWNAGALVNGAAERLADPALRGRTLYLASSSEPELARLTSRLADLLAQHAADAVTSYYQQVPQETHATIYHPAALQAFRRLFPLSADTAR